MVNINKLTKGFKLKINKKKKSNWRTLNSRESLPPTPSEEYMLYSDTEAELYQAKVNVEANRSFVSYNNSFNNENNINTNNILAGLNSNNNFVGRSKTTYTRPTTNTYTYNNSINAFNNNNNNQSQSSHLYPGSITANSNSKPVSINKTSSSNNSTPYTSAPNSPLSIDSSDTYVNEHRINDNNPFKVNINSTSTINPKATTTEINTQLSIATNNIDPSFSHTLVSPIEFDGNGKEIKSKSNTNNVSFELNNNVNSTTTETESNKDLPAKSKSIKKLKPLITFDTPPVVTPMAPESDSDEVGHRRRSKKNKKYSKKRSSPSLSLKTSDIKEERDNGKKSAYIYSSNKISSESSALIAARANKRLNSPTEEDDDVPLGIIQYKCLSSLLQESAPPNISSLQSNTKSYKSSHIKDDFGYLSPSEKYDIPRFTNYSNYYHENYVI